MVLSVSLMDAVWRMSALPLTLQRLCQVATAAAFWYEWWLVQAQRGVLLDKLGNQSLSQTTLTRFAKFPPSLKEYGFISQIMWRDLQEMQ